MPLTLIRTNGTMPPGGFPFSDPITGIQYTDLEHFFDDRVAQVLKDRLANRRLITDESRVNPDAVAREISIFVCQKLNGDSKFCTDGSPQRGNSLTPPAVFRGASPKNCPKCGSEQLKPNYCKTCASVRVTGFTCQGCGFEIST